MSSVNYHDIQQEIEDLKSQGASKESLVWLAEKIWHVTSQHQAEPQDIQDAIERSYNGSNGYICSTDWERETFGEKIHKKKRSLTKTINPSLRK